jgi:diguanylate cyclase (GGDEF)-like protein
MLYDRLTRKATAATGLLRHESCRTPMRNKRSHFDRIDVRQMDTLRVFHEVARSLTSNIELEPLLLSIMAQMEDFFGPERWSLLMIDEETNELYYALSAGLDDRRFRHLRIPMGEGIAGHVAVTGYPLIVNDVNLDKEWAAYAKQNPLMNLRSIACLPVRYGDRMLGVLQLHNSQLDMLPDSSLAFLRVMCDYTAIALQNARSVKLIHHLSITDDCTGLYNARYLYTMLEQEITPDPKATVVPIHPCFSLVFFDLDHFKSVNDTYGHLAGSRLLSEIGGVIKRTLGPEHAAFRYGGDEFVVLLHGLDKRHAVELTETLYRTLNEARFLTALDMSLGIAASFGLATFPEDGDTMQALIRSADAMMYEAKARGRNCIAVADPERPTAMAIKTSRHV